MFIIVSVDLVISKNNFSTFYNKGKVNNEKLFCELKTEQHRTVR